jgi:hypothetical protein
LIGLAVGVLLTLFILPSAIPSWFGTKTTDPEEERPPVVVSSGSVLVGVPPVSRDPGAYTIPEDKRGEFKKLTKVMNQRHTGKDESKDKSVDSFDLWFSGVSGPEECTNKALHPLSTASDFTIQTTNGEITVTRHKRGSGNKYDMRLDFPENPIRDGADYKLKLDNPHQLQSVTFNLGGDKKVCTFDAGGAAERWMQIWPR